MSHNACSTSPSLRTRKVIQHELGTQAVLSARQDRLAEEHRESHVGTECRRFHPYERA
jgi:hypothetical protein